MRKAWLARLWFGRRARLAVEAALVDLDRLGLKEAVRARRETPLRGSPRRLAARALASAVGQEVRRLGEASPCLVRSLALLGEVRRLGFDAEIVLGFRPDDGSVPEGHAWLRWGDRTFLEPTAATEGWVTLVPGEAAAPSCRHPS